MLKRAAFVRWYLGREFHHGSPISKHQFYLFDGKSTERAGKSQDKQEKARISGSSIS